MRYLVLFLLSASIVFAKGVEWKTWNEALALAKSCNKIIMIDAVRDGCHYCDEMDANVFKDDAMAKEINKRFIPVKIVINRQRMPLGIEVSMTPSFYFISADKKILKSIPGSWSQEDFRTIMEEVK